MLKVDRIDIDVKMINFWDEMDVGDAKIMRILKANDFANVKKGISRYRGKLV